MKKVLVVGESSFVGRSFAEHMHSVFEIDFISSRQGKWNERSFAKYDAVLMAAALVHRKKAGKSRDEYFAVNRDLAIAVARKAQEEGVGQYIFLSTLYAYGISKGEIALTTLPKETGKDAYGDSKLQAEEGLLCMQSENFSVAVVRPPMVYGPNGKGNFPRLVSLVKKLPIFPTLQNRRSMIYTENLSNWLRVIIGERASGVFLPQNHDVVSTVEMVRCIAHASHKQMVFVAWMNPLVRLGMRILPTVQTVFGDLYYSQEATEASKQGLPIQDVVSFKESILRTMHKQVSG